MKEIISVVSIFIFLGKLLQGHSESLMSNRSNTKRLIKYMKVNIERCQQVTLDGLFKLKRNMKQFKTGLSARYFFRKLISYLTGYPFLCLNNLQLVSSIYHQSI